MKRDLIEFVIDKFTPHTIPMYRLAEYMRNFADLLGNEERVHFHMQLRIPGQGEQRSGVKPNRIPG